MIRILNSIFAMGISLVILIPLMILAFPAWIFVSLCVTLEKKFISSGTSWEDIIKYEPVIGWKPKPNLNDVLYFDPSGDRGSISTDDYGWPGRNSIIDSDIVVFGDSFAFGFGSDFKKTYYKFNDSVIIKPIACPGYNMVQDLLLMKRYAEKLKGKLVVLFICMDNDFADNLKYCQSQHYANPFVKMNYEKQEWEIVTSHVQRTKWLYGEKKSHNSLRFANLCIPSAYADRVFSACEYVIQEAKKACDAAGAELLVFTIPDKRQLTKSGMNEFKKQLKSDLTLDPDLPDSKIEQICNKLNLSFLSGKNHLTINDYKVRDSHWNERGNEKVGALIHNFYSSRNTT
jgi:hypothetical protein